MNEEKQWAEWAGVWQQEESHEALPSAQELKRKVLSRKRRMAAGVVGELLAGLFVLVYYAGLFWTKKRLSAPVVAIGVLSALFVFVWCVRVIQAYRNSHREASGVDSQAYLETLLRQVSESLGFLEFSTRILRLVFGVSVLWSAWMVWAHLPAYRKEPWRAAVGLGGILLILSAVWVYNRRRIASLQRERERLLELSQEG